MSQPPYYASGRTVRMRPLPVIHPDGTTHNETIDAAICMLCSGIDPGAAERIADSLNHNEFMTFRVISALRHLDRLVEQRVPANSRRAADDPVWEARNHMRQALGLKPAEPTPAEGEPVK